MMNWAHADTLNSVRALRTFGQSVWLDDMRRSVLTNGELRRLIAEEGVSGVTFNCASFENAITGTADYAKALNALRRDFSLDAQSRYERLAIEDMQAAADMLQPVYAQTKRRDGYVSWEVSPHLARDTQGTLDEARRLWNAVGRDNLMIQVPATPEGIPAIVQLLGTGINVHVTLIFSQHTYERVAEAYLRGLEEWAARGGDVSTVAGVASLFVRPIDTAMDALIAARLMTTSDEQERALVRALQGHVAIANAKVTYQRYQAWFSSPRWEALARRGAMTQRVLWAGTGAPNADYPDVLYWNELIGPETINSVTPATLQALRDHGRPESRLTEGVDDAKAVLRALERVGFSLQEIMDQLLEEGLQSLRAAFDKLLDAVEQHANRSLTVRLPGYAFTLPASYLAAVQFTLNEWADGHKVRRLWERDPSLWTDRDEAHWLGWLESIHDQLAAVPCLTRLAEDIKQGGFTHIVVLGMGGSSLSAEVIKRAFGQQVGYPELHILDSTDPAHIQAIEGRIHLESTLFIVSSKSGNTLETNLFKQYFFHQVQLRVGMRDAGRRFLAITDPGSPLQQMAQEEGFRQLHFGDPTIGGRYSALSHVGLVPAALMGVDVAQLLERAEEMVEACSSCVPAEANPGLVLGTILGVLAQQGRDKVTFIASPGLATFGAWLEQLLAVSTGKEGKGLIPVDLEQVVPPQMYGRDRLFIYIRLQPEPDKSQDEAIATLEQAGQPVVRISVADLYDLGQEFFRWEFATAVAAAIMGLNPFNQPDVEVGKIVTNQLIARYETTGALPLECPLLEERDIKVYADPYDAKALYSTVGRAPSLTACLRAHLNRLAPGDYFALLAYLEMNPVHDMWLRSMRHRVRDAKGVATCLGFGPRFLHSTGQVYKAGPNRGLFLQVTCEDAVDLPVPGQRYPFGLVKAAQARGDLQVLAERGRRLLHVHLGADVPTGLAILKSALDQALGGSSAA